MADPVTLAVFMAVFAIVLVLAKPGDERRDARRRNPRPRR